MAATQDWMTSGEVAAMLGISPRTVRRYARQGVLPAFRFLDARGEFRFRASDVKAYMGHADISTTMIYVHHVPQVDAAARLSRLVAQAATGPVGEVAAAVCSRSVAVEAA
jgi:excisionase family DNA binding protein